MADKKVKGAGDRFLPGSNIAKHREWRGLKDTWYDYVEWVKVLGIMGGFVAKSPVRIARGMLTYRWMGSYLGALNMIDRCVEGLRGRDFSERTKNWIGKAGFGLMLVVFAFAMNNDLTRLFEGV